MATITTHVVLFNMNDKFTSELEAKASEECKEFVGHIPGVVSATFGHTFTTEHAKNFTHCLVVGFSHPSHLSTYGPHEVHQKWAKQYPTLYSTDILKVDIDAPVHSAKI
ncbi:hypothetical protein BASA81_006702 [Batrachochytrium salamandrivorans]|nr:hypothetical protein BASA81_006702 [Batrachochytrium salamandrivorans]